MAKKAKTVVRQAIKYKPPDHQPSLSDLKAFIHRHYCTNRDCLSVYADGCDTPDQNRQCPICRTGKPGWLQREKEPKACCYGNTELVADLQVRIRFGLGGPGPWWMCRTCSRPHGSALRSNLSNQPTAYRRQPE